MDLSLPLGFRLLFILIAGLFALALVRRDLSRASQISQLFVLVGILTTFWGIAASFTSLVQSQEASFTKMIEGLGLSLGGSIVGVILTLSAETVLYLVDRKHLPTVDQAMGAEVTRRVSSEAPRPAVKGTHAEPDAISRAEITT